MPPGPRPQAQALALGPRPRAPEAQRPRGQVPGPGPGAEAPAQRRSRLRPGGKVYRVCSPGNNCCSFWVWFWILGSRLWLFKEGLWGMWLQGFRGFVSGIA